MEGQNSSLHLDVGMPGNGNEELPVLHKVAVATSTSIVETDLFYEYLSKGMSNPGIASGHD